MNRNFEMNTENSATTEVFGLLNSLPGVIFYTDRELRFLFINSSFEKTFGVTQAQCVGKTVLDIFDNPEVNVINTCLSLANKGTCKDFEIMFSNKRGGVVTIRGQCLPDKDRDGITRGVIAIGQDVSMEKAAIEENRRNEQKVI